MRGRPPLRFKAAKFPSYNVKNARKASVSSGSLTQNTRKWATHGAWGLAPHCLRSGDKSVLEKVQEVVKALEEAVHESLTNFVKPII